MFSPICDTLSIDADCLRSRLVAWKDFELERREATGDTTSVQVGRSPFPTYFGEKEAAAAASSLTFKQIEPVTPTDQTPTSEEEDEDVVTDEAARSAGTDDLIETSTDPSDDFEHVSLEDLALEEVA